MGRGAITDPPNWLTFDPAKTTLRNVNPLRTSAGEWLVEAVAERLPSIGILLLERLDADAAARCWRIIIEREWEALIRNDR